MRTSVQPAAGAGDGRPRRGRLTRCLDGLLWCGIIGLVGFFPAIVGLSRLDNSSRLVSNALKGSPRAKNVDVWGNDEGLIGATLEVDGDPNKTIQLNCPRAWGLRTGSSILLQGIGRYGFLIVSDGWGHNYQPDIGSGGEFGGFLPVRVKNVRDLIDRYDDVVAAIDRMPKAGVFHGVSGRNYAYRIMSEPYAWDAELYERMLRESREGH